MRGFRLSGLLAANASAGGDDVLATKRALGRLGRYRPRPGAEIDEWPDQPLFEALQGFQRERGLLPDGLAKPGGPTETALRSALAEREGDGREGTGRPRRPRLRLDRGVGDGQANRPRDLGEARKALAWAGYHPTGDAATTLAQPTVDEDELLFGLQRFQRDFGLAQDGVMRPGGETERALEGLIAPLLAQAERAAGAREQGSDLATRRPEAQAAAAGTEPHAASARTAEAAPWTEPADTPALPRRKPEDLAPLPLENLRDIDLWLLHQLEGGLPEKFYTIEIRPDVPDPKSGPTISAGVDIGQMEERDIDRLVRERGLDPALADKLRPYVGLKGQEAKDFVDANPLVIDGHEAIALADAKYSEIREDLERKFDAQTSEGEANFAQLPKEVRTVALSVAVQYGPDLPTRTPRFWAALTKKGGPDVTAMIEELRDFGDDHEERRGSEADHLERAQR